ncbi:MAG TPA: GYF domain-containing protein [Rhizomicrobium sp.]|jgi:hypothetical protein|nr:GYF domain-containing protein [Rhizomicrobium sp.]
MTDSWNINVGGRSYGPYSLQQMQGFVAEGRLAPHSRVSQPGSDVIVSAKDDAALAKLFSAPKKAEPVPSATGRFFTAKNTTDDDVNSPKFGRSSDEANGAERGRYLIIADMKSRSISGLEEEILNLGPAYALLPQIWLLVSDQSMNAIRNALVQKLGKIDMLFIIDATRNKATWFNFGPEADARIRRVWSDLQVGGLETIVDKR